MRAKEGLGSFYPNNEVYLTCLYDNIMGIAQISVKGTGSKTITEKLLDEFNLQHLRSLTSGSGEIRRLMMARIMINKPRIVLLDEPLAALDPLVIQDSKSIF